MVIQNPSNTVLQEGAWIKSGAILGGGVVVEEGGVVQEREWVVAGERVRGAGDLGEGEKSSH